MLGAAFLRPVRRGGVGLPPRRAEPGTGARARATPCSRRRLPTGGPNPRGSSVPKLPGRIDTAGWCDSRSVYTPMADGSVKRSAILVLQRAGGMASDQALPPGVAGGLLVMPGGGFLPAENLSVARWSLCRHGLVMIPVMVHARDTRCSGRTGRCRIALQRQRSGRCGGSQPREAFHITCQAKPEGHSYGWPEVRSPVRLLAFQE